MTWNRRRLARALVGLVAFGCNATPRGDGIALTTTGESTAAPGSTSGDASTAMPPDSATSTDAVDETGTSTGDATMECTCAPGTDLVHVLSDDGELWSYDPRANAFALVGTPPCGGYQPFSMAVDREGMAWLLLLDDVAFSVVAKGLFKVPIADASTCDAVAYEDGIFGAFGTSFVSNAPPDTCEHLYVQSYSGDGPFAEGEDLGTLGVLDPETSVLQAIGPVDFDGGELAGTGDGRLFSLSGVDPLKLLELDKQTAEVLGVLELVGYEKTGASAMAFWGGDFWMFTESANPTCMPCLEMQCEQELTMCDAEPACQAALACMLAAGGEGPGCQGDLEGAAGPLLQCFVGLCADACNATGVVSRVLQVDWDAETIAEVESFAPIRIVGAGSSTCAPVFVP